MAERISTPSKTKEIIEANRFAFKKNFGQNFLIDSNILDNIAACAGVTKEDCVLEIGPGIGSLTQVLAENARQVVAVEIDNTLIPILKQTLEDYDNIEILNQDILKKKGDDVRIDWGHFYLAAEKENSTYAIGDGKKLRKSFMENKLEAPATNGYDKLALVRSLGETKKSNGHLLIGYDDIYSIQYFGENLRPYWNRTGSETIVSQFQKAEQEYKKENWHYSDYDEEYYEHAGDITVYRVWNNILCEYEEKNISVESGNKLLAGGELHELDGILYDIIDEETGLPYAYEMNEMTV